MSIPETIKHSALQHFRKDERLETIEFYGVSGEGVVLCGDRRLTIVDGDLAVEDDWSLLVELLKPGQGRGAPGVAAAQQSRTLQRVASNCAPIVVQRSDLAHLLILA